MVLEASFPFYAQHHIEEFPFKHGHAYRFTVFVKGEPDQGIVMELDELGRIVMPIVQRFTCDLNTLMERPTLENIATEMLGHLKGRIDGLICVRLEREYDTAVTVQA